ncbi:glycosyltransferase [Muricoccus aerilatus]|uniref:glycosyltransferase n=1 Tax=Muricoccus aerilatus TaxID=452982 RepID=UPI0005C25CDA|nr:glycosyltransferase [Roseomonas aerilata]
MPPHPFPNSQRTALFREADRPANGRGTVGGTGEVTLQRVLLDRPVPLRPLYWTLAALSPLASCPPAPEPGPVLRIPAGAVLGFDTYFNAFFEANWRARTALGALFLRLDVSGACTLRVTRRTSMGETLLLERRLEGGPVRVAIPDGAINFRQHGLIAFSIGTHEGPVEVRGGAWVTEATPRPVGLAAVFCTFNRENDIAAVLAALTSDEAVLSRLARIHVVNQGRPGLAEHPAIAPILARHSAKLRIIEQANFGGAGGFGRGILAAIDDPAATHAVLLDDDIRIEPDSMLRMAAFFGLATDETPLGGHMLDMVQPMQVYEAGAVIRDANWSFHPQHHGLDVSNPRNLTALVAPRAIHFNGWWCLGFPLSLVERLGMPLPVFIRGDDVEFGLRLYGAGVPAVAMPGVGVWHEPFYLKLGSWQLYYETRNMLVAAALHLGTAPRGMAVRMARALLLHLLTFRYYSAALILRAISDFLRGPEILNSAPAALHASLNAIRERYPAETVPRGVVLPDHEPLSPPPHRLAWLTRLARALAESTLRPTRPGAQPRRLEMAAFGWTRLGRMDCLALETWWDKDLPILRRSRESFRALVREAIPLLRRLLREGPAVGARWREAFPRHRSVPFWRDYLGMPPAEPTAEERAAFAGRTGLAATSLGTAAE